jgi:hypothetical protein
MRDMMSHRSTPSTARKRLRANVAPPATLIILIAIATASGCRSSHTARRWPETPQRVVQRNGNTYRGFDLDDDGRLDYLQRVRNGYIDRLYFPSEPGGPLQDVVTRPCTDPHTRPALILLLDGIAYERLTALRDRGHFLLFRPPVRLVSTFPTATDVAYDAFFDCGPTPGFEAGYFDRPRNRLSDATRVYLSGANERWVRYSDYRISPWLDAVMYLFPKGIFTYELRAARRALDECLRAGRRHVVLYILSTDGLGHMLSPREIERQLVKLDHWLERIVYDWRGELEIVALADHGMSAAPTQSFDLCGTLREAGLRVTSRLKKTGDVAVPLFGLMDMARIHTFDDATRDQVLAVLRDRPEIELMVWRMDEQLFVRTAAGEARISARRTGDQRLYKCEPVTGDPLNLAAARNRLKAADQMDDDGYASRRAWLTATASDAFPAAVPRLWDGLLVNCAERPDVALSLSEGWHVGSGALESAVKMQGTHGGLHRRASVTFVMTTSFELPSPLTIEEAYSYVSDRLGWTPAAH